MERRLMPRFEGLAHGLHTLNHSTLRSHYPLLNLEGCATTLLMNIVQNQGQSMSIHLQAVISFHVPFHKPKRHFLIFLVYVK